MLDVERITIDKFEAMAEEWEDLHAATDNGSFFQNWQWIYAWWQAFSRKRALFVLSFRDGHDLVGLVPLFQENRIHWTGLPFTVLRFLGAEKVDFDHLDFLYRPGYGRAVACEFLNYLERYQNLWDSVQLWDLSDDSSVIGIMQAEAVARGFALLINGNTRIYPYLILPANVVALYEGLSDKLRRKVASSVRRVHELGFRMQVVEGRQNYLRAFWETVRLDTLRWQTDSLQANFMSARVLDFHRMLLGLNARNWQPCFTFLLDAEKIIAAFYGFVYRDKLIYYQLGYDPAYAKYSPTMSLIALAIEYAIGQHLKEFDFVRGDEPSQWKWGSEYRRNVGCSLFQRRLKCGVQIILDNSFQEVRRQFRKQTARRPESKVLDKRALLP